MLQLPKIKSRLVVKVIYKVLRSIIFSVTLVVVGLYVLAYTLLSIPAFTNSVKDLATAQISEFLGGEVKIADFDIYPFNEVKISGLQVFDPEGRQCLRVETIGAGISLWKLLTEARIELTFGEIIGLEADIIQPEKDAPLNINFILEALAPKSKDKPKKEFEIALRNVVLRKSRLTLSRPWDSGHKIGELDLSQIAVEDLAADITFPKISDSEIIADLRRLSLNIPGVAMIEKIGLKGEFSPEKIRVENFILELPQSRIHVPLIEIVAESGNLAEALKTRQQSLVIDKSYITPADFSPVFPELGVFTEPLELKLSALGNMQEVTVENFYFGNPDLLVVTFTGGADGLEDIKQATADLNDFNLRLSPAMLGRLPQFLRRRTHILTQLVNHLGHLEVKGDISAALANTSVKGNLEIASDAFSIEAEGGVERQRGGIQGAGEVTISHLRLNHLLPHVPVGRINANIVAEGSVVKGNPQGMVSLVVEDFELKGKSYEGFSINLSKEGENIEGDIWMQNALANIEGNIRVDITGSDKNAGLNVIVSDLDLSEVVDMKKYDGYLLSGTVNMQAHGSDLDDAEGVLTLSNCAFHNPESDKSLKLKSLHLESQRTDNTRLLTMHSDYADLRAEGEFRFEELPVQLSNLAATVFPTFVAYKEPKYEGEGSDMEFDLVIKKNNSPAEFFNLPVRLLVPVTLSGSIQGRENSASLTLDVPYLQQGKDKLIYDSRIVADINGNDGTLNALVTTTLPMKKGDLALNLNIFGKDNSVSTDVHWINTENSDFRGHLVLDTDFSKNRLSLKPEINVGINPSVVRMGEAEWNVSRSNISYSDNTVRVNGLKIWHDNQLVEVEGVASPEFSDVMRITLADIDVDYIFNLLQINYVTFGGVATGEISGRALLSGDPVAETDSILIKEFTYNGCYFGECLASSRWNNEAKEIEIGADITDGERRLVKASGGIWLGKDSLSFDLDADKVPVDFVQPFMAVFSSHVGGYATGEAKLFGTFHDIDMTGKIFADSVAVKLDYTNTIYHGSDSVILSPGRIDIPNFRLYDKFGNSALLTGELTHRYFHDPSFTFRLSDANNFLCYDTNKDLNPDWYGILYGTGSALLQGVPGLVDISADMTVSGASAFTFVLNDTQYAQDYQFLTFSDRKKESAAKEELTAEDFKAMLKKSLSRQEEGGYSKFGIDIRASVTPQVLFTLVMDPAAGDKITARGQGAMQVKYESDNDEMMMYGKYEINEGNYNFSLQDIILRDFKIKEGSYITFNGNPLAADLDISATYRVNTNLSDLDKSFSTDRDLNRTNVPVDAVLSVTGNMTQPDITFDIELPTLTQDVERKVKSIISTDDMMNRQIIYLLALNRFYTPEYMGNGNNGGELAGFASSTISSQLSNILGQLTDKFSVSPSFRSDKGDFSDIEVDVALSSRLLNNRLLINGNFGYRDRSNSSTTFVGDFDVEYLLSKNGNLRLKAYNHFNDQNYYLREALTTQGLGIVYRRDFDNWFTFLQKRRKAEESVDAPDEEKTSDKTDGTED